MRALHQLPRQALLAVPRVGRHTVDDPAAHRAPTKLQRLRADDHLRDQRTTIERRLAHLQVRPRPLEVPP